MRSLLSMTQESPQAATNTQHGRGKKKKKTHQIKTCTPMFTAVLFTTAKLVHLCGSNHSTHQWRNTMRHLHAIEYCSALKRNEILICATSLVNFEITTLSEINQTRKDKCCMTPPPWGTQNRQYHRDRKQSSSPGAWRRGEMRGNCLVGISFLFGMLEKFWKWIAVMVTPCEWI